MDCDDWGDRRTDKHMVLYKVEFAYGCEDTEKKSKKKRRKRQW